MCGTVNPVGNSAYCYNKDKSAFPELYSGSYEFDVGEKYTYYKMRKPTYVFLIDTTIESFTNGCFNTAIYAIKSSLDSIPNPENTHICILTIDQTVQAYQIPNLESDPKVVILCDETTAFIPVPSSTLLLNLVDDREKLDYLLEKIQDLHNIENNKGLPAEFNLSIALETATELLLETGGRILAFFSRIDNKGPGGHQPRDNHKFYNTDKEKTILNSGYNYYWDLSQKLKKSQITVDLFL